MMQQLVLDMRLGQGPTMANFCVGPNLAAWQHLQIWLGQSGIGSVRFPVPTYLWGDSSSGKTHLLRAVGASLAALGQTAGWLDASDPTPGEFEEHWSAVLMDDVQAFDSGRQHLAFNWFINAQTHRVAVIAAGRLPPADLPLRDDLRTRLGWGHVFALHPLDESERRAVLRASAQSRGLLLSDEVMAFMLTRFSRDLGSLMELLDLMDGYALQTRRAITIPLIQTMMDNA